MNLEKRFDIRKVFDRVDFHLMKKTIGDFQKKTGGKSRQNNVEGELPKRAIHDGAAFRAC
ncbi:MAG: hypothetical protein KAW02_02095 [candidate division Zixibacteria bacterium]|nr:hypothetical protein [candidate division Zixibacteria bacterium]